MSNQTINLDIKQSIHSHAVGLMNVLCSSVPQRPTIYKLTALIEDVHRAINVVEVILADVPFIGSYGLDDNDSSNIRLLRTRGI